MTFNPSQTVFISHLGRVKPCMVVKQDGEFVTATSLMQEDKLTALASWCFTDRDPALRHALEWAESQVCELRMELGLPLEAPLRGTGE
ncbi:hypothetical protein [Verrucomicrobium sp. BvORR106]|uniref:hypothetical protein n=1 Tax=Verrucomicrobium sp. BvORR106 TaxID=1403819 RepID=UPI00056EBAA5|nr:hypothetical protein [Verrucomicrobium sp. BvORR106]